MRLWFDTEFIEDGRTIDLGDVPDARDMLNQIQHARADVPRLIAALRSLDPDA